jgi:hypothetical protein
VRGLRGAGATVALSRLSQRHRVGTCWKSELPRRIVRGTPHHLGNQPFHARSRVARKARGRAVARLNELHAHVESLELERERRGEPFDGHLARRVHGHQRHRRQRRARGHVHHHTRPPRAELGQHRLRHRHHAEGVGLEQLARRSLLAYVIETPQFTSNVVAFWKRVEMFLQPLTYRNGNTLWLVPKTDGNWWSLESNL